MLKDRSKSWFISQLTIGLVMSFVFIGCADKKTVQPSNGANLTKELPKLDPLTASTQLTSLQPRLGSASQVSSLQVPIIEMTHDYADIVQVLRCSDGTILTTPTGQDIRTLTNEVGSQYAAQQMAWAWQEALGRSTACRIVGTNISRVVMEDLSAPDASFFYVLNPCVSAGRSTTGKEGCSYNLVVTSSIAYENNLKPEFIEKSKVLSEMEGLLTTHFSNLIYYSRQIRDKTRQCEDKYAHDQTKGSFLKGITKLAAGVVGAVVGTYIGGPTVVAGLFMGVAGGIMQDPPQFLDCPTVDGFIEQAKHTTSLLQVQTSRVLDLRKEMAQIESRYNDLDSSIAGQTGSGVGGTSTSGTSGTTGSGTETPADGSSSEFSQ